MSAPSPPAPSRACRAETQQTSREPALDYLRPGDTLCVWKLDRFGRSIKEVLTIADALPERGIAVQILTGKLSGSYSSTGEGKSLTALTTRPGSLAASALATAASASALDPASEIRLATRSA